MATSALPYDAHEEVRRRKGTAAPEHTPPRRLGQGLPPHLLGHMGEDTMHRAFQALADPAQRQALLGAVPAVPLHLDMRPADLAALDPFDAVIAVENSTVVPLQPDAARMLEPA